MEICIEMSGILQRTYHYIVRKMTRMAFIGFAVVDSYEGDGKPNPNQKLCEGKQ